MSRSRPDQSVTPGRPARHVWGDGRPIVLVVDEHPGVRVLLGALLAARGLRVVGLERADEAERRAREADLVILDWRLLDRSGIELCRAITRRPGAPPVIVLSTDHDTRDSELARHAGAAAFVSKGRPVHKLLAAVEAALR